MLIPSDATICHSLDFSWTRSNYAHVVRGLEGPYHTGGDKVSLRVTW